MGKAWVRRWVRRCPGGDAGVMLGALVTLALAAPALHHLVLASPLQVPILVQQHSFF